MPTITPAINLAQLRVAGRLADQHQKVTYIAECMHPMCIDVTVTIGGHTPINLPQRVIKAMMATAQSELTAMLNELQLYPAEENP